MVEAATALDSDWLRANPLPQPDNDADKNDRGRVLVTCHQVTVLCMRYLLENMDEAAILAIDREGDVANCAITEYAFDPTAGKDGNLVLARYNVTAPMEEDATPVTTAPDKMVAARG